MENKDVKKLIVGKKKGTVVSVSSQKTVIVAVDDYKTHSKYRKKYRSTKRYKAHDEESKFKVGDKVEIVSCRPISKDKRYKVVG